MLAVASAKVAFHLVTATVWGFHRDEFYYLASGRRLAWGYVDHPPLTPLLYRAGETLFGTSELGLRVVPALIAGTLVVVAALIARELGGDARAQTLTSVATAAVPMFITIGRFLGTTSLEPLLFSMATLLVIHIIRTGELRLWLAVGIVAGIGLLNKFTMLLWGAGVIAGILLTSERRVLRTPWLAAGGATALLFALPTLLWQASHRWPFFEFAAALRRESIAELPLLLPLQLVILGLGAATLAVLGWRRLFSGPYRSIAIAYVIILGLVFATAGKFYYVGPFYPVLLAAGAIAVRRTRAWIAVLLASAVGAVPFTIPFVPVASVPVNAVNEDLGEFLGWPELVDTVVSVHSDLPEAERATAVILTSNYSEAGAIELWGRSRGLPQPKSGHNSYWWWGAPASEGATVIAVGLPRSFLERFFSDVGEAVIFRSPVENEEDGSRIHIARGQRVPWALIWPEARHYS